MTSKALHDSSATQTEFSTVEPRCKVCRSRHRREIDIMLAMGWPQASVRDHWNGYLRRDRFTANNLSSHARHHLNHADPPIRSFLNRCAKRAPDLGNADFAVADRTPVGLQEAAAIVAASALAAINAGLVVPDAGDLVKMLELLWKLEGQSWPAEKLQIGREMRALVQAIAAVVPDSGEQIDAEYHRRLAELTPEDENPLPRWIR
jgi:hypothetical protein